MKWSESGYLNEYRARTSYYILEVVRRASQDVWSWRIATPSGRYEAYSDDYYTTSAAAKAAATRALKRLLTRQKERTDK